MEVLSIILLIAASASPPQAVAPTQLQRPPGIVILKWSWNEYPTVPGNNPYLAVPRTNGTGQRSRDPFGPKDALEGARKKETVTVQPPSRDDRPVKEYQYRVTIKNTGTKTIKGMSWDYIFLDPAHEARSAHHRFRSEKKIRPGKKQQITQFSLAPPTRVVNVRVVNKTEGEPFVERVIITRIEYVDGSVWQLRSD
jgi:hypothetical protein